MVFMRLNVHDCLIVCLFVLFVLFVLFIIKKISLSLCYNFEVWLGTARLKLKLKLNLFPSLLIQYKLIIILFFQ